VVDGIEIYVAKALAERNDPAEIKVDGLIFKRLYVSGVRTDFMR
jgi:hypothetical protein